MQRAFSKDQLTTPRDGTDAGNTGFVHDTRILTLHGQMQVQALRPGDGLIARRRGTAIVREIKMTSVITRTVYVIAGSLGHTMRTKDTLLSADQPVLLRDWRAKAMFGQTEILVRAGDLIDGEFVRDLGPCPMTLFQIRCDRPQVIYADGMELATAGTETRSA